MSDSNGGHFWDSLLTFMAGAAAGFIAGVLLAPASGTETRKKIKEQAAKTGEAAKGSYGKISKEAEKSIRVVKEKTNEGLDAIKDFIEKKKEEYMAKPQGSADEAEEEK
jgi:gas vesicle protein